MEEDGANSQTEREQVGSDSNQERSEQERLQDIAEKLVMWDAAIKETKATLAILNVDELRAVVEDSEDMDLTRLAKAELRRRRIYERNNAIQARKHG